MNIPFANTTFEPSSYTSNTVTTNSQSAGCSNVDRQDIQNCLEGDQSGYARLVGRHQDKIGRYMFRFTRDKTDREMLVQDVFVEAYYSLHNFKGTGSFSGWLKTIATRVGYKYWKQQKRHKHKPLPEDSSMDMPASDAQNLESKEAAELVHFFLAKLPPRDRLVLTLVYLDEQSMEDVAKNTGWSYTMVKVQTYRARKKLKKLINEQEDL